MTIGLAFWLLMILLLLCGLYWNWPAERGSRAFVAVGGNVLLFVLLFLLGWKMFGFPIQG